MRIKFKLEDGNICITEVNDVFIFDEEIVFFHETFSKIYYVLPILNAEEKDFVNVDKNSESYLRESRARKMKSNDILSELLKNGFVDFSCPSMYKVSTRNIKKEESVN